jgi:GNAT superfamily N-acetyltransferase
MSIEVKYDKRAASTEAFAILAEAWNELTIEGITPEGAGAPPYGPDAEVLYAVSAEGDIVGVITWEGDEEQVDLKLAYVEPSSRESGVFGQLFQALKERVYARGVRRITCTVPTGAANVKKALASGGCTPASVTYEIKVG